MLRTTGRPPLSSRLSVARTVNGEWRLATASRSTLDLLALPCSSSCLSGSSPRVLTVLVGVTEDEARQLLAPADCGCARW
jgi:hypothetical protein